MPALTPITVTETLPCGLKITVVLVTDLGVSLFGLCMPQWPVNN